VREALRNPTEVLKNLMEKSKNETYRFQRLYRNLYNPEFYWLAYKNIYANDGSMTAGADGTTIDGMGNERIERIILSLKDRSYQPKPARREYIAKKNSSKKRPLGIQSGDDKLVQEVVKMILESIYEPVFSNKSHGFRPNRSCQTALKQIQNTFTGANWFVEGDIHACFDSFDHHVVIDLLKKRIDDEAFIQLIWKFLKAGYMEHWTFNRTYSGVPQGSGVSPVLANIYLTPKGNATLVDDFGGNKQLITVTTKSGNYFYILIDRAAEGEQTVHFLNQVDEADLMALTETGEAAKKPEACNCTKKCEAGKVNTSCPVCATTLTGCTGKEPTPTPTEQPEEPKEKGGNPGGVLALVLFVLLGGGAAFYYFKFLKPKQNVKGNTDLEDFDFEDYDEDEPEADTGEVSKEEETEDETL